MIPEDVESRIALHYFHHYLPIQIMEELESLLVPQYLGMKSLRLMKWYSRPLDLLKRN